jgi:hypothetical protein
MLVGEQHERQLQGGAVRARARALAQPLDQAEGDAGGGSDEPADREAREHVLGVIGADPHQRADRSPCERAQRDAAAGVAQHHPTEARVIGGVHEPERDPAANAEHRADAGSQHQGAPLAVVVGRASGQKADRQAELRAGEEASKAVPEHARAVVSALVLRRARRRHHQHAQQHQRRGSDSGHAFGSLLGAQ